MDSEVAATSFSSECMNDNVFGIQYANSRLFVEALLPDPTTRSALRNNVARLIALVLDSFQVGPMRTQRGEMRATSHHTRV